MRRYDPPVRPSYTEPGARLCPRPRRSQAKPARRPPPPRAAATSRLAVSHPSDSQPQRSYAGDVPIPLTELSITQVCEWALSLGLDATPFWVRNAVPCLLPLPLLTLPRTTGFQGLSLSH